MNNQQTEFDMSQVSLCCILMSSTALCAFACVCAYALVMLNAQRVIAGNDRRFFFIRLLYQCYGDVAFFHFSLKYMMIYRLGRTRGGGARSAAFPKIKQCKGLFELFNGAKTLEISVYNLLQGWSEV